MRGPEMRIFRLPLFIFILLSLILIAPRINAQSFNIVDVSVAGNKSASSELILSVAAIKKGDQLTSSTSQEIVRRLYGLNFFKDISIDALEVTGGIALTIKVIELPKLAGLEFKGNKVFKSKDLTEDLKLPVGSYISSSIIFSKENAILTKYGDKGYFLAHVDHELVYSADSSEMGLTFKIDEGSKIKVEKVELKGNARVKTEDIIGKMRNRKRGFLKSSNFSQDKYPEDKDKVIEFLHKRGYIDAYLRSDSMAIDSISNRMTIYLDIYEGPCYYFGKTDWKGNEIFSGEILSNALKYKEGQVFDQEKFEESLYEIYFLYQEKGHLHVRAVDDRKTRDTMIDVTFDIVEGLPSKVNLVKITGNTKTKEKVIRREMAIMPGQVFHRSLLIRSVRNIMQLNYFGNVNPDIGDLASGDVDVLIKVEEKPTGQVSAGAGYSAQDKFVGTLGLGIPNFRGMGQNLSFNVEIGSSRNSYSISFTEPWLFSTPTLLGTELYFTNHRWYDDYTEGRKGGSVRFGRRLRWPDNYCRVYARYRLEGNRFNDFSDTFIKGYSDYTKEYYYDAMGDSSYTTYKYGDPLPGSLLTYGEKWYNSSGIELSIERDSRNLPEFATAGSILSYTFENTGGWLGGYWKYQKHTFEASKFITLFWKIALAAKISVGAISTPDGDRRLLESDRFSPGGTSYYGTVRGYDDGSLTPDTLTHTSSTVNYYTKLDSTNIILDSTKTDTTSYDGTVRGKYLMVGNLEMQVPIIENQLYGLLFFDVGNSWLNKSDIKFGGLYKGVGIGFRLVVPMVGTIGFDFGYPLDNRYGQTKGWHPHFQVGTTFK
jgi:outer membrane protein insertion porin family